MATNAAFGLNTDAGTYPSSSSTLTFGVKGSHADFVLPMVRFEFLDPTGQNTAAGSPIIFMRLGGTFQTAMSNGYNESQNIFGNPNDGNEGGISGYLKNFAGTGASLTESLYKQIAGASQGALGYLKSGGLTGKAQYEFVSRRMLNTFQQLIYQGPTFRRFSLPFSMRPTSLQEAQNMIAIINSFRHASSPKANSSGDSSVVATDRDSIEFEARRDRGDLSDAEIAADAEAKKSAISDADVGAVITAAGGVTSFGYPDMCGFRILLTKGGEGTISTLFSSETCVIENVSIDYGSQNKMVFFDAGADSKYYPSDVTLTLSLKETTLLTTGSIASRSGSTENTIY
jgi:hypothetical protein